MLIGLLGKSGSGKTVLAMHLVSKYRFVMRHEVPLRMSDGMRVVVDPPGGKTQRQVATFVRRILKLGGVLVELEREVVPGLKAGMKVVLANPWAPDGKQDVMHREMDELLAWGWRGR
jgi:hypothetical protein